MTIPAIVNLHPPPVPGRDAARRDDRLPHGVAFAEMLDEQASGSFGQDMSDMLPPGEPRPVLPESWTAPLALATTITSGDPDCGSRVAFSCSLSEGAAAHATAGSPASRRSPALGRDAFGHPAPDLLPAVRQGERSPRTDEDPLFPCNLPTGAVTIAGHAAGPGQADPPSPARQIITYLTREMPPAAAARHDVASGQPVRQLRLRLQPEELGEVHISLRLTGTRLAIDIRTERADAARLIDRDASLLGAALSGSGIADSSCPVQISVGVASQGPAQAGTVADGSTLFGHSLARHGGDSNGHGQDAHQRPRAHGEPDDRMETAQTLPRHDPDALLVL